MHKYLLNIILGLIISLLTTFLSTSMVSFGFMGGQIYSGFPINLRLGYEMNFQQIIIVFLLNAPIYILLVFVFGFIKNLIFRKSRH
jgi:hypothetical protein